MLEKHEEYPLTIEEIKEAAINYRPSTMRDCFILEPPVTIIRKSNGEPCFVDIIDEKRNSIHLVGTEEHIWFKASFFKLKETIS